MKTVKQTHPNTQRHTHTRIDKAASVGNIFSLSIDYLLRSPLLASHFSSGLISFHLVSFLVSSSLSSLMPSSHLLSLHLSPLFFPLLPLHRLVSSLCPLLPSCALLPSPPAVLLILIWSRRGWNWRREGKTQPQPQPAFVNHCGTQRDSSLNSRRQAFSAGQTTEIR